MAFETTLQEAGVFCREGQPNRYVKMVFKEWGQLQGNFVKTFFKKNFVVQFYKFYGADGDLEFLVTNSW